MKICFLHILFACAWGKDGVGFYLLFFFNVLYRVLCLKELIADKIYWSSLSSIDLWRGGGSASVLYFLFQKGFDVVVLKVVQETMMGALQGLSSNACLKNKKKRGSKEMPC